MAQAKLERDRCSDRQPDTLMLDNIISEALRLVCATKF